MACLTESTVQQYLEELAPDPIRQTVEHALASCIKCRATLDRVASRNRRVNTWLAKLPSPLSPPEANTRTGLARVLTRIGEDSWKRRTNPRAFALSLIVQATAVAALFLIGTNDTVRHTISSITLIEPVPMPRPLHPTATKQAGGGGQHSPLPPIKGQLPRPAPKVFTVPVAAIEHPALILNPSLLAPPDAWAAPTAAIGNPLGVFNGSTGPGDRGGLGPGDGVGIGDSHGPGAGDGDIGIYTIGNGVSEPQLVVKVDPEYSEEARKAKYSGSVTLSIVINTSGRAEQIQISRGLGMGLDEKAVQAIQRWRFKPAMSKGVPVKVRATVEVNFRLL
jgi:TonB family protein